MKSIIIGAGSDLGVHIDGAHLGPHQLINDIKQYYNGEIEEFIQDESIIKSRGSIIIKMLVIIIIIHIC